MKVARLLGERAHRWRQCHSCAKNVVTVTLGFQVPISLRRIHSRAILTHYPRVVSLFCSEIHNCKDTTRIPHRHDTIANLYLKIIPFTSCSHFSTFPSLTSYALPATLVNHILSSLFSAPFPHNPASNAVPPFLLPTTHGSLKPRVPRVFHVGHGVL